MIRWHAVVVIVMIALAGLAIEHADGYRLYVLVALGLTAIVGVGLNVLVGLTGQISLGQVGFYAIGAYTVGILTTRLAWSFWPALAAAAVIAGIAGVLLAMPALRVRGPYLAMVTIAFGFVVEQGAAEWEGLTGGWNGLSAIGPPQLFDFEFTEREIAYFVLALVVLSVGFYSRLSHSPWGKAMRAVRDSETASLSIGLNPTLIRTTAFAISAVAAGVGGGVHATINNFISPESFPFFQSIFFLLAVMLGGAGTGSGPVVGSAVVVVLPELLSALGQYRLLFVGGLMLLVLRLAPSGVAGLFGRLFTKPSISDRARGRSEITSYLASGPIGQGLSVHNLAVGFGGVQAVDALSFEAKSGAITSIIGPNGAGKSTVLNLICGFYRPTSGSIELGKRNLARLPAQRIARAGIARTYQTSQLFDTLSVLDNVLIALWRGRLGVGSLMRWQPRPAQRDLAESLLDFVGYRGPLNQTGGALSHVDKRLVEIARALAMQPAVVTLDEPAAGLARCDKARIGDLLQKMARAGITVILVEHDMELVMSISSHIVVLDAGAKIAEGSPADVASDANVLNAYLGTDQHPIRARRHPWAPQPTVLRAKRVSAGYGNATIIKEVSLTLDQGEVVAVLGSNGAGKSTLLRAFSGLIRCSAGEVIFLGERIDRLAADRIAARGLVLVPEGRQVFPEMTVENNLRLGAHARGGSDQARMLQEVLNRFPRLQAKAKGRAGLLSGGEQQMLAIARGLMAKPRVLILDEPSLGLAPQLLQRLYDLIAELRDEGTTILLVDQMAALALSVADRAYVLLSGSIRQQGAATDIARDPALVRAYLGDHE
jgi:branched-chain amino acid transport system ATP-binding protein